MFCKQTVSAELWANFRKICGNCPFMEYFLTRKLCESTCILQGARFLLKKAFAFAKLRTRNIVFETLASSTTLLLTKNWLDKVIIKKPYNKYIGLPTKILFLQQKITFWLFHTYNMIIKYMTLMRSPIIPQNLGKDSPQFPKVWTRQIQIKLKKILYFLKTIFYWYEIHSS